MLTLTNIAAPKGANRKTKRIGRGQGSGRGTQAGKGHKGQKARKSGHVRIGFEGGSMPIYMRLPKRGFSNAPFKTEYAIVNLETISTKLSSNEVSRETLIESGILKGILRSLPIKILGEGEMTKAFNFKGIEKFSKTAKEQIEKSGGKIQ